MNVAFVTPGYDPQDITRGSGTFYHLYQELDRQGWKLHAVGPIQVPDPALTRILRLIARLSAKKRYLTYLDPFVARARGKKLSQHLANAAYDTILTNDHGIAAFNFTGRPVILYTDVMLPRLLHRDTIAPNTPLARVSFPLLKLCQQTIRRSLANAALCVFPAEWQVQLAAEYGLPVNRARLIPFGANIADPGTAVAANRSLEGRQAHRELHLLFVGKDWQRKGGDIALGIAAALRSQRVNAFLHIVGVERAFTLPYVKCYGILNKASETDRLILDHLYRTCHVLLAPSSSEGFGVAPREAAAYGMPTLAYAVEGLTGAVVDGETGVLLTPGADVEAFCSVILGWLARPEEYSRLSRSARAFYKLHGTWERSVSALREAVEHLPVVAASVRLAAMQ